MKKTFAVLLLLGLLVGGWFWSISMQPDTTLRIDNPRIRLLPGARPLAGYFSIHNAGAGDLRLISASSERFDRITIHASSNSNGQSHMTEQPQGVVIAAGERVEFAPGGLHLMLLQAQQPLAIGDEVQVLLHLVDAEAQARDIEVPFTVIPVQTP